MRTRTSSNLVGESSPNPTTSNPKRRNRRLLKQPFSLKESPVDTMVDQRTMAELLRAPTEVYAEAIVVPPILAEHFELKHSLINMMTSDQFFELEKDNSHDHIHLLHACPHHGFTELHQLDTFYNASNPTDQDSLNSAAGGNLLERSTRDVICTLIENKSKVRNSRNKSIVSKVKSSDVNSSSTSEIAKLTHAVNQQTSDVTTVITTILKQFQATPPHLPYRSLPSNTVANPRGELKAITTQSGLVLDGPSVHMPPPFINPEEDEHVEETLTDSELAEYTIKGSSSPNIPYPSRMHQEKQQEKDEVQIHKFWQMFKQLHINITLADALVLILKYQKMLKSLLSNKEKLLELANTSLNENCSAVTLKKLPKKLGDPRKFLISCGFSELKCKALADLGASINLMPLSVWKKLGLPELISTRMTLELANREICTPVGIARDVFVSVGKFTFPADFVIVDYESDPHIPLILGRPFLRTAHALIDVHGEEMILYDGDERLTLNMRHDTTSYSNKPKKESINMIDIYNVSHKDYLEDLFANEKITNHQSGNPTFSSHTDLTSPEVNDDIFDLEGDIVENLLNLNKTKDLPPYHDNPLSGSTTSSLPSLPISETSDYFLEEFADELAHFAFPPGIYYLPFDIKSDLREIEYFLNHDPIEELDSILEDLVDKNSPDDNLVDTLSEIFTDEHALDYSSPSLWDDYDDELFDLETVNDDTYDDPFDSKEQKIKDSKILIDELDPPGSS
ncbi:reverse transcriptase domain-containing protein, partial [Tanacetum coccineum]